MKQRTIIAAKKIFHGTKSTEGRVKKQEEINKEPLNEEYLEMR